jgi:hypothetical protein
MAYDIRNLSMSLIASSSYTTSQYKAVFASTATEGKFIILGTTVGNRIPIGILQNNPGNGEAGEIWVPGCISKILTGGVISLGQRYYIKGNGRAFSSTGTNPTAQSFLYGPTLEASAGSSEIITVSFNVLGRTT